METARTSPKKILFHLGWPVFFLLKAIGKSLYSAALNYEFYMHWGSYPTPESFNHEFSLAFFPSWRKAHFFERGVYLQEVLGKKKAVLDLCCGDGSVTALFISPEVESVVGLDFDPQAIALAQRRYSHFSNVTFQEGDIRALAFPAAKFDVVSWDAAIEHFTQTEMDKIFASIRSTLKPGGILAGSTVAKMEHVQHHDHEFEFENVDELSTFLKKYFKNVFVWERRHEDRVSFYFRCADGEFDLRTRSQA